MTPDRVQERVDRQTSGTNSKTNNGHQKSVPSASSNGSHSQQTTPNPAAVPLHLSSSEFNMAMVHFYRGEVQRSNTWRNRLDTTTNWAVITAGATLSFVFGTSSAINLHFAIPINSVLIAIFLFMEARRYRYYEVWANRVRVLETGYFSPMLSPREVPSDKEWAEHLAADLMHPHFTISSWEAVGRRLRSNYIWIFVILALSWILKVYLHPYPATDMNTFIARAGIGDIPGWFVLGVGIAFNLLVFCFAVFTIRLREASSEVLPHSEFSWHPLRRVANWTRRESTDIHRTSTGRRAERARQRVRQQTAETRKGEIVLD